MNSSATDQSVGGVEESSSKMFPSFLSILAASACFSPVAEMPFLLQMETSSPLDRMDSLSTSAAVI